MNGKNKIAYMAQRTGHILRCRSGRIVKIYALVVHKKGMASTNSIESVWAVLKRGLTGVYHKASKKHLRRYVDEFAFRLNDGKVARHTLERLNSFVDAVAGKRLTYARLIA